MEIIQRFTENENYLLAIRQQYMTHIRLSIPDVIKPNVAAMASKETMEKILNEPLGQILFHQHLRDIHCFELILFIENVKAYDELPPGMFKDHQCTKIVKKFLNLSSGLCVTLPDPVRKRILQRQGLGGHQEREGIFAIAFRCVQRDLYFQGFGSFLSSNLYRRLVSVRVREKNQVSKDDFEFIRILGQGGFGKVYAVQKKDTMQMYACKAMSKEKVIERKREKLLQGERNALTAVNSPFIIGLRYAFQDSSMLYFVLDLVTGGELEFHLKNRRRFYIEWIQFFLAGIINALDHLHKNNYVYRDLKPENVLLDSAGYIRLADLGLCGRIEPGGTLSDHCGTRSFMAPEQCMSSYRFEVDWWALGVTAYKLMTKRNPFSKIWRGPVKKEGIVSTIMTKSIRRINTAIRSSLHARSGSDRLASRKSGRLINQRQRENDDLKHPVIQENPQEIGIQQRQQREIQRKRKATILRAMFENTLNELSFPVGIDECTISFIKGLLQMDPDKRLGHLGAQEIRSHPFFKDFNWEKLEKKHLVPPFVPNSQVVHADFLEPSDPSEYKKKFKRFENFDYVAPMVFQEEIKNSIYDQKDLMNYPKRAKNFLLLKK